jgi:hypothetical protein
MKKVDCRTSTVLLIGLCAGFAASSEAADERSDANSSCRQETKRVLVWPHGSPKAPPMARFETREVTVCDAKVSRQSSQESSKS